MKINFVLFLRRKMKSINYTPPMTQPLPKIQSQKFLRLRKTIDAERRGLQTVEYGSPGELNPVRTTSCKARIRLSWRIESGSHHQQQ